MRATIVRRLAEAVADVRPRRVLIPAGAPRVAVRGDGAESRTPHSGAVRQNTVPKSVGMADRSTSGLRLLVSGSLDFLLHPPRVGRMGHGR